MQPGVYNMTFAFNKAIARGASVTVQYEEAFIEKFFFPGDGNRFSLFTIPGEGVTPFPVPTETLSVSFTRQYYVSAADEEVFVYRALDGALLWRRGRTAGGGSHDEELDDGSCAWLVWSFVLPLLWHVPLKEDSSSTMSWTIVL